jgi:hypothetical protein
MESGLDRGSLFRVRGVLTRRRAQLMANLDVLLKTDEGSLDRIWDEVPGWVREPRRPHRSYSVKLLRRRLNLGDQAC